MTTIKKYNPYTGKHQEVAEPDPSLGLPKTAIIVIEDGVQKIVHRCYDYDTRFPFYQKQGLQLIVNEK